MPNCNGLDKSSKFALTRKSADLLRVFHSKEWRGIPVNVRHSTTPIGEKRTDRDLTRQWKTIDWKKARSYVNRLQTRIAKATCEGKWNLVKRLQYILTHSYYGKLRWSTLNMFICLHILK